jgi:branched-chain amino acid transport system permease protein
MSGLKGASPVSLALIVGITALALVGGAFMSDYWRYVLAIGVAQSIFGLSIGVVYGQAGMLSVAQVSIGAIGAWSVGALSDGGGPIPLPWSLFIGAALSVVFGLVVALPALRLRQINLAVVTLGVVLAVYTVAKAGHVPGSLITIYVPTPQWGPGYSGLYRLAWLSFGALAILTVLIRRTRMGLSWLAIARSERAAAAIGISVVRAKLTAFAVAAGLAGWAGGLLVVAFGSADPANFEPVQVLTLFVLAVMMGAGLWEGALALGLFNAVSSALFRQWGLSPDIASLLFAVGAVQILAMESGGFSYDIRRLFRWIGRNWLGLRDTSATATDLRRIDRTVARVAVGEPAGVPALALDHVTVRYGKVTALDDVSFEVPKGRVVGLIGPNGAGKSTLVDAVTGFVRDYDGEVRVGGQALTGQAASQRAHVARRTFQTERTIAELTPRDFLRLASSSGTREAEIDAVLAFVGCPADAGDVARLDVRLRRLLTIGACLIGKPAVVLIDEPAAGLTTEESEDLSVRIREIPGRFDCGVLLIEHDMELVRNVCDSLVVLDFGKLIAQGPTAQVLADPRVMAAYLGEDPGVEEEGAQWAAS